MDLPSMASEIDIPLIMKDFEDSIKNIQKSVSYESLKAYDTWMREFGAV
jgi:SpoVK/Ycf46/Vps4 family AAA+-type ATPase